MMRDGSKKELITYDADRVTSLMETILESGKHKVNSQTGFDLMVLSLTLFRSIGVNEDNCQLVYRRADKLVREAAHKISH